MKNFELHSILGGTRYCQNPRHHPRFAQLVLETDKRKYPLCGECYRRSLNGELILERPQTRGEKKAAPSF